MKSRHLAALSIVESALQARLADAAQSIGATSTEIPRVTLPPTRDSVHGDFATPVALAAAKLWKCDPMKIASSLAEHRDGGIAGVASLEAARPGFVNVRMAPGFWSGVIAEVLELGDDYGRSDALAATGPLLIEFTSANP